MTDRFTPSAEKALSAALAEARKLGHSYIGTEHLLLGLLSGKNSVAAAVLCARGVSRERTRELIISFEGSGKGSDVSASDMSPRTRRVIEMSAYAAMKDRGGAIGTGHILTAILNEPECVAVRLIKAQNASSADIYADMICASNTVSEKLGAPKTAKKLPSVILKYGTDLSAAAERGELDPVFGRGGETEAVIRILSRRTKNNPCLIGEPGVGKTAIAEGLAIKIAEGSVPDGFLSKRIAALDLPLMLSGAKYRGEFEERMKNVIDAASADPDIILFIDEIHTIVGAGSAEGAVDAANMIKPALSRGRIRVIGATTDAEYRKFISRDAALERRFTPVRVCEPTADATESILAGLRGKYEEHHRVVITDEAISAAVRLSARCLPERRFPDKAIDILDEAAARKRLSAKDGPPPELDGHDIAETVAVKTGMPAAGSGACAFSGLEARLSSEIFGQDGVIAEICPVIRRAFMGFRSGSRPIGSFVFLGAPGTGKTRLAEILADAVFGSSDALIRLDMSEYSESHCVSKLIGSPPGYVGYRDEGALTGRILSRPRSVVLFDSAECAHPDVFPLIRRILESGFLDDSSGRRCDFGNSVVIIACTEAAQLTAGFGAASGKAPGGSRLPAGISERADAVLAFSPISRDTAEKIAERELDRQVRSLAGFGIKASVSPGIARRIAGAADVLSGGARAVINAVRKCALPDIPADGKIPESLILTEKDGKTGWFSVTETEILHII